MQDVFRLDDRGWYPKAADGLETHEVADGYIIYQSDRNRVHYLNQTAAVLLALCTGQNRVTEMPDLLQSAFSLDAAPEKETRDCLERLVVEGLID